MPDQVRHDVFWTFYRTIIIGISPKYRFIEGIHRRAGSPKTRLPVGPEDRTGGWTEPMVWSLDLEGKDDLQRFEALNWGLRTWDLWDWNDCLPREIYVNNSEAYFTGGDRRFGDEWPGRMPAQMIAHILYYFCSKVTWPSILIIFDPHYFDKKRDDYSQKSISTLPRQEYLAFLESLFAFMKGQGKKTTRLAFINADWRDFQNTPAAEETHEGSILIDDYLSILNKTGWQRTHIIQAPLSTQSFIAGIVSAMQKNRILGVTSRRNVIALKQ